jgi:glycosyltransferase involved in cell wall biosynthesis
MVKLNVIGGIFGSSGYASHTRQLANALYKLNPEISLESPLFNGWETKCNDEELKMLKTPPYANSPTLSVSIPHQWQSILADQNSKNIMYCVWEGSCVPKFWLDIFTDDRVSYILVPSKHTKEAIINTCFKEGTDSHIKKNMYPKIEKKIVLCPHGVNLDLFKPMPKKEGQPFRFICNKGWSKGVNDRGGMQYAIKAFNEEFSKDEPVEMMIKINSAYNGPDWNLAKELDKLELKPGGGKIAITTDDIPYDKLPEFYSMGDVFLAPNMSESFGLPIAEAMACGLPCITTNYGGQTDFVTKDNGWLIDYDLVEVDWDFMYEGVSWARPKIDHLRKLMRYAYEHPLEVKVMGERARQDIQGYTWENTAKIILKLI